MFAPLFDARFAFDLYGERLTGRPAVPIDYDLTYIWFIWLLLLIVLVTPVWLFLTRGWWHRRSDILSNFSPEASALYLLTFRSADDKIQELWNNLKVRWNAMAECEKTAKIRSDRVVELRTVDPPNPDDIAAAVAIADQAAVAYTGSCDLWKATATHARPAFEEYYDSQFGQGRFIWPGVLLLVVAAILLFCPATAALISLRAHAGGSPPVELSFWVLAVAVLGGYTRVLIDLIDQFQQENIRPSDLLRGCFRLLISVPMGYVIGKWLGADGSNLASAVAFLMGLFPTSTVMTIGRRIFYIWTKTQGEDAPSSPLLVLSTIDRDIAEQFKDERIANVTELAYADPVRLSIRTGLGFGYVITCQSEALLAGYLFDRLRMDVMRLFGISGAYEAATLYNEANDNSEPSKKQAALALIDQITNRLKVIKITTGQNQPEEPMTKDGLVNILAEVAGDPYTWFIRETWATTIRS